MSRSTVFHDKSVPEGTRHPSSPSDRTLVLGFVGIMLCSLVYSYALIVHQPIHELFVTYKHSYMVARALNQFGYPYYPNMDKHDEIIRGLYETIGRSESQAGAMDRYGSTKNTLERWIESEPVLVKMDPERVYLIRPFLYEGLIAFIWRVTGEETFSTFIYLSYVSFNLGVLLMVAFSLIVTRSLWVGLLVAGLTFLYTPYAQFARPNGLPMFVFPLSVGVSILIYCYVKSANQLKQIAIAISIGIVTSLVLLTRTDEIFWLPILVLLWSSLAVHDYIQKRALRYVAVRLIHLCMVLAVVYLMLLPFLRYHEKHTGERFLGLGGYVNLVVGWRIIPNNNLGPPMSVGEFLPVLKEKGYYSGNEEYEPKDLRNEVQSFDLDRAAQRYALDVFKQHPGAVLLATVKRIGYLPLPYAYRSYHLGFWLGIPPAFTWRLVAPEQGGLYVPDDTFYRFGGGDRGPFEKIFQYFVQHPIPLMLRSYAYFVAPVLACVGGMMAILTILNPYKYALFALGLWYVAKALFTILISPLGSPYLLISYAPALAACVMAVWAWRSSEIIARSVIFGERSWTS